LPYLIKSADHQIKYIYTFLVTHSLKLNQVLCISNLVLTTIIFLDNLKKV